MFVLSSCVMYHIVISYNLSSSHELSIPFCFYLSLLPAAIIVGKVMFSHHSVYRVGRGGRMVVECLFPVILTPSPGYLSPPVLPPKQVRLTSGRYASYRNIFLRFLSSLVTFCPVVSEYISSCHHGTIFPPDLANEPRGLKRTRHQSHSMGNAKIKQRKSHMTDFRL